jgi:Apoptogenic protein 1
MLVPLLRPSILRPLRLFHSSVRASDYVGPPDPVSNIRPVLYDDPGSTSAESPLRHPYALDEFRDEPHSVEYQWKLQRQQLDAFNDGFWRDVRLAPLKPFLLRHISYIITPCRQTRASRRPRLPP